MEPNLRTQLKSLPFRTSVGGGAQLPKAGEGWYCYLTPPPRASGQPELQPRSPCGLLQPDSQMDLGSQES